MSSALDEFKKPIEDWACALVDGKPMENLLILYKLLYALGCRIFLNSSKALPICTSLCFSKASGYPEEQATDRYRIRHERA